MSVVLALLLFVLGSAASAQDAAPTASVTLTADENAHLSPEVRKAWEDFLGAEVEEPEKDELVEMSDGLDKELGDSDFQSAEDAEAANKEFEALWKEMGHEIQVSDTEFYDKFFERTEAAKDPIDLDPHSKLAADHLFHLLTNHLVGEKQLDPRAGDFGDPFITVYKEKSCNMSRSSLRRMRNLVHLYVYYMREQARHYLKARGSPPSAYNNDEIASHQAFRHDFKRLSRDNYDFLVDLGRRAGESLVHQDTYEQYLQEQRVQVFQFAGDTLAVFAVHHYQDQGKIYTDKLRKTLEEWNRPMKVVVGEDKLLVAWMVWKSASLLRVSHKELFPDGEALSKLAGDIYGNKTYPSLGAAIQRAVEYSKRYSWEELNGSPGWNPWNWIAKFVWDYPTLSACIPVFGSCWAAGMSLMDAAEGRNAAGDSLTWGERAAAGGWMAGNFVLAVLDVSMVTAAAKGVVTAGRATMAIGRAGVEGFTGVMALGKSASHMTFSQVMKNIVVRLPAGALEAGRMMRIATVRELKRLRNRVIPPPEEAVRSAKEAAMREFAGLDDLVNSPEYIERLKAMREAPGLSRKQRAALEAYNPKAAAGATNRVTGETLTDISAGGFRRGVMAGGDIADMANNHERLVAVKKLIEKIRAAGDATGLTKAYKWYRKHIQQKGANIANNLLEGHHYENCAEWGVLRKALKKGWKMEDIVIYTVKDRAGTPFVTCLHCRLATFGSAVASNWEAAAAMRAAQGISAGRSGVEALTGGNER